MGNESSNAHLKEKRYKARKFTIREIRAQRHTKKEIEIRLKSTLSGIRGLGKHTKKEIRLENALSNGWGFKGALKKIRDRVIKHVI